MFVYDDIRMRMWEQAKNCVKNKAKIQITCIIKSHLCKIIQIYVKDGANIAL